MDKPKIFISHITSETGLAQVLKKHLVHDFLGFIDIFVSSDLSSIQAGRNWLNDVHDALIHATVEIVLCSTKSVQRPWVNFEAGAGWIRNIPVIPICHSGMKPTDLPLPLNILEAIEANNPESLKKLYDTIAKQIGLQTPNVDFNIIAQEISEFEGKNLQANHNLKTVENPNILCATTKQYEKLDFNLDVQILENAFPGKVTIERNLTSKRLRNLLTTNHFDIIHLVLAVDQSTGDLIFSPIETLPNNLSNQDLDRMSPIGFANFLSSSGTQLVVLATCEALFLAAEIADVTNMVASEIELTSHQAAEWCECFYDLLKEGVPLYKAYEITKSNIEVRLILVRKENVAFAPKKN